ncbi:phosphoglucomutase/phosphomannomutase alpha/beta/alpha domain I [Coriobacterium glomerans PW2]|uniref:Phosphoglucomutase/phosphomannomutase alpha/beta/alpha domain I n=1 Tax=Coriobacterium glomerans (strain ATCC 49209 / DSM 20642 / JCM 10262 / PW2) TaxID=700015 RepID=F2NAD7_CORGP|nr:phosphoglucomutase [Coriobacterium glomerans]AEB06323.1 phosphoglucomutase/phosphomannomutase alpha/beta/alpha domain I [Coriobacterium glomerans PW2]
MGAMIHFGTDGWRARLDGDFNDDNLVRIADAAGRLWARCAPGAITYVGFDTRPGAERFACLAGEVLAGHGLAVKVSDRCAPTPALSWTVAHDLRACGGFMITGSHSPVDYLGVKLRHADGGTAASDNTDELESMIEVEPTERRGPIGRADIMTPYLKSLARLVDHDAISRANLKIVCDPMYGSARGYLARVLGELGVEVAEIHGENDDEVDEVHPDPIEPWVDDCEQAVLRFGAHAGLVNDGDADRVGAIDERGRFVNPHKIIALLATHLVRNRNESGRVVLNLSASALTRRVARALGCRVTIKPVGFRYIYEEMRKGDVLIGGEEAGGIGIPWHVPERDGLLVNLLLCEMMAMSHKPLGALVEEMEGVYGSTFYTRRDLRLEAEVIETFRTLLPGLNPKRVAGRAPIHVSHMDGLRLEFDDESWLLLRPSGAEPVVRVYAEAATIELRDELLEVGCDLARGDLDA